MQHDAITKDSPIFHGNPSPVAINSYKKAYKDALAEQGLSWNLAAEIRRKTQHCNGDHTPQNCDNTATFNRIIEGMNLDDISINSQGEVLNHSKARRDERKALEAEINLRRLGVLDDLDRATDQNALALQALNIRTELANIRQTFDFSKPQSELDAVQRKYRSLTLKLQSIEVAML